MADVASNSSRRTACACSVLDDSRAEGNQGQHRDPAILDSASFVPVDTPPDDADTVDRSVNWH